MFSSNYQHNINYQDYGFNKVIKDRARIIQESMYIKYPRVLFVRFDVTFPVFYDHISDNKIFQSFIANLTKHFSREGCDPKYLWVREQNISEHHHYHVCMWVNGAYHYHPHAILSKATELWNYAMKRDATGCIDYCYKDHLGNPQENGLMISRYNNADPTVYERCLDWAKYLAKNYTKGNAPHYIREWGSSRI
jgi:hypothetical protein